MPFHTRCRNCAEAVVFVNQQGVIERWNAAATRALNRADDRFPWVHNVPPLLASEPGAEPAERIRQRPNRGHHRAVVLVSNAEQDADCQQLRVVLDKLRIPTGTPIVDGEKPSKVRALTLLRCCCTVFPNKQGSLDGRRDDQQRR
jgi:hypothetical protein